MGGGFGGHRGGRGGFGQGFGCGRGGHRWGQNWGGDHCHGDWRKKKAVLISSPKDVLIAKPG